MLYLNHRETKVKVLGPGVRYAVWVQGCKRQCVGCIYPESRSLDKNGYWVSIEELANDIEFQEGLTGVTISGGEPFLQSREIAKLVKKIKKDTTLDIMIYTGYTIDELKAMNLPAVDIILSNIDILVDGEYRSDLNNNTLYRGSDNQKIIMLSDKYREYEEIMNVAIGRDVEFVIKNDEIFMVGIPPKNFSENLKNALLARY